LFRKEFCPTPMLDGFVTTKFFYESTLNAVPTAITHVMSMN